MLSRGSGTESWSWSDDLMLSTVLVGPPVGKLPYDDLRRLDEALLLTLGLYS